MRSHNTLDESTSSLSFPVSNDLEDEPVGSFNNPSFALLRAWLDQLQQEAPEFEHVPENLSCQNSPKTPCPTPTGLSIYDDSEPGSYLPIPSSEYGRRLIHYLQSHLQMLHSPEPGNSRQANNPAGFDALPEAMLREETTTQLASGSNPQHQSGDQQAQPEVVRVNRKATQGSTASRPQAKKLKRKEPSMAEREYFRVKFFCHAAGCMSFYSVAERSAHVRCHHQVSSQ
ncbi:hypothetical protein DSO57_1032543 [Entomophthora muscae]|uniref:Uncharacterized protein n=1 Tax=Entomophthora muscae TaxID=34485 RepID=A0ACC2UKF1_9FUNG|nr:hypothetical protein DSO57_1032543 [Entomophthora muscae]